jgi:hypothetical protein
VDAETRRWLDEFVRDVDAWGLQRQIDELRERQSQAIAPPSTV